MLHLPDDAAIIEARLADCVQAYDVILMSGGVSMGKFDYVPDALEKLAVKKLFHKVAQRPENPSGSASIPTEPWSLPFPAIRSRPSYVFTGTSCPG
jgi:molybdopterin biosynthesis enzyme